MEARICGPCLHMYSFKTNGKITSFRIRVFDIFHIGVFCGKRRTRQPHPTRETAMKRMEDLQRILWERRHPGDEQDDPAPKTRRRRQRRDPPHAAEERRPKRLEDLRTILNERKHHHHAAPTRPGQHQTARVVRREKLRDRRDRPETAPPAEKVLPDQGGIQLE